MNNLLSRNKILLCMLILVMLSVLVSQSVLAQDKIVIKYADFHPLDTINYESQLLFKEILEQKVGDKVEVKLYPGGQLGAQRDLIEQVKLGTIDMTFGNPPYFSNLIPAFGVMDLPYIFNDYYHIERVVAGEVGSMLNDLLIKQEGMRILGWFHIGFRDMITSKTPIRKIEDFKGVKFRSPEVSTYINMFKALGATPTPIPWTDVYQAMQTKLVDGLETSPEGMTSTKVYEVGKYVTLTNHINTVECPTINEAFYQSLPEDVKQALHETMDLLVPWQRYKVIRKNIEAIQELKDQGCEIIEIDVTPLRKACETVWEQFKEQSPLAETLIEKN